MNVTSLQAVRVLIVDDHPIMRRGLSQIIEDEPGFDVCGEAADGQEALRQVESLRPDIAIVDISLGEGGNGLELIKDLKAMYPEIRVLVSSMHDEVLFAERVIRAGALGYVNKDEPTDTFINALRRISSGHVYLNEHITDRLLCQMSTRGEQPENSPLESLSDRELEVFEMIGRGLTTKQAAARLGLSHKTIETYRENIKAKLNLNNSSELTRCAVQWVLEGK